MSKFSDMLNHADVRRDLWKIVKRTRRVRVANVIAQFVFLLLLIGLLRK